MMKLMVVLIALSGVATPGNWRTPNTSADIEKVRKAGANTNGNFVGLAGTVGKISVGYVNKPIFELLVEDRAGKDVLIVGSLLNAKLDTGDKVEVLGDVVPISVQDDKAQAMTKDKFMALGLCIHNISKNYAQGAEPAEELCKKWYSKEFPKSY